VPRKNDICYATQNRQDAVKDLCSRSDLLLVVGASNSSNSNRLRELGERAGIPSYLIATADDIDENWLTVQRIGVTAGASAPEELVQQVVSRIKGSPSTVVTELAGREENITTARPIKTKASWVNSTSDLPSVKTLISSQLIPHCVL